MTWSVDADGFYITLPEWVEESGISDRALRLWCKLSKLAMLSRGAPVERTRAELAALMGCSKDTVDRLVRELEEVQALDVERRFDPAAGVWLTSRYRVLTARPRPTAGPVENPVGGGRTDAARGTGAARGGRTDPDIPSSKRTTPQSARVGASPSPRSPSTRAVNGSADAGLTPCPKSQVAPAATCGDKDDLEAVARELADRIAAAGRCVTQVRFMVPVLRTFLERGHDAAKLERAAAGLSTLTEGRLGVAVDRLDEQAARATQGPPGRVLVPRPGPPPPPRFRAEDEPPPPPLTAEEAAEVSRRIAEFTAEAKARQRARRQGVMA